MSSNRKKPGVAFWATVMIVCLAIYVASLGPACWISSRTNIGAPMVSAIYRPMTWGMSRSNRIADAIAWYSQVGSARNWAWVGPNAFVANWHWEFDPPVDFTPPMGF
jgi:hypothetical protein